MSPIVSGSVQRWTLARVSGGLRRAAMFALVWVGLNGWDTGSWLMGGPFVLLATWASLTLLPQSKTRMRWSAVPGFGWYFARESLRGGVDVARRTLRPAVDLNPAIIEYEAQRLRGRALRFFLGTVSLLPGTLAVGLQGNLVRIHALDRSSSVEADLRRLESRVARLFGAEPRQQAGGTAC